jgi:TPR repeat protein
MRVLMFLALLFTTVSAQADITSDWADCSASIIPNLQKSPHPSPTDARSQYCLGLGYATGRLGQKDLVAATKWFELAAAQNHPGALTVLGYHYEKGYGVVADPVKAASLYKRAADQGSADGMFNLARAYENGIGLTADKNESIKYYQLAARAGNELAKRALSTLSASAAAPAADPSARAAFELGSKLYQANDQAAAFKEFMRAAQANDPKAQLQVGYQYEFGEGVPENFSEAVRWYTLAARQGDPVAEKNLGNMYEEGKGVQENWIQAATLYRLSAEQHYPKGQLALGRMYEFGMGVPQSRGEAINWFSKAAQQGNTQAQYFANYLSKAGNFIGFRTDQERNAVLAGKLRFALIFQEPVGQVFRNSGERNAYLVGLRHEVDLREAQTFYGMAKDQYDSCRRAGGESCVSPGQPPQ